MFRKLYIIFMLILTPTAGIFAADEEAKSLYLSAINEPYRGQPFILSLSTQENTDYFSVKWQDVAVDFPADCDENNCGAEIMLPTEYEKAGLFELTVVAHLSDGSKINAKETVAIKDKEYPKESLTVDPKYVSPPKEVTDRIAKERQNATAALRTFSDKRMWTRVFTKPVPGAKSGVFGEQRLFNGQPRNKHSGLDFRGAAGVEIKAVADGKVILTGDYYYNGMFVFVDHGQGVITSYLHMSKIIAKQGDDVKAGDVLGLIGATGRVTGPHLHMGLHVQGIAVDPEVMF